MSGEISPHWTLKRGGFILEIHAPVLFSPSPSHFLLFHTSSSHFLHAHTATHGTGGRGEQSTSRAVHPRVGLPAARASVRWRERWATTLPPRSRGCTSATRRDWCGGTTWEEARHHSRWAKRCGAGLALAQVRRARAATPWRTGKFTRSRQAVFNSPERPKGCNVTLRAACVPRRITCVTRTSLRRRQLCFTWPQIRPAAPRHRRALGPRRPTSGHCPTCAGRRREVEIEAITGEERQAERRPGSVAESG